MLTVDFERFDVRPGMTLLDLGCGGGRHSFEAMRCGARVVAVDLDDVVLKDTAVMLAAVAAEEGGDAFPLRANALSLPFPDRSFDRIIVSEVLEHIPADEAAIREIRRILRPDGVVAVTVPRFWPERVCWALSDEYHQNEGGHVRIYKETALKDKLRDAGLELSFYHYAHALHAPFWWLKCALGPHDEDRLPVRVYHRFLVWDLTKRPIATRALERALDPVLGKSLVVYARASSTTPS
ncbi:MAG: methyltransferase domain-containing protein [Actinomycetota bacterium]